jgi:hypothetical protein
MPGLGGWSAVLGALGVLGSFSFLAAFSAFLSFLVGRAVGSPVVRDVAARDLVTASTALAERATTGRVLIDRKCRSTLYS